MALQFGWAGEKEAVKAWSSIGHSFSPFVMSGTPTSSRTRRLWEITRKVLGGKDTVNYAQKTGDCFVPGTRVTTRPGEVSRPIESVRIGDIVTDATGNLTEVISVRSLRTHKPLVRVTVKGSEHRELSPCTTDHRYQVVVGQEGSQGGTAIRTQTAWKAADELRAGDYLTMIHEGTGDLIPVPVEATTLIESPLGGTIVHDIGVASGHHSFLADGVGVHNCVSFGSKNAVEYVSLIEIHNGDNEVFHPIFPPFHYGTGRVLVGNNQLRGGAGSLGSWQAKAVEQYGSLRSDYEGVPQYSGSLADNWGDSKRGFEPFMPEAGKRLIRRTARIRSWEELVQAICNGYPVTIASNQGWQMKAGSSGYHEASGSWPHQMCIVGICDEGSRPWCGILNSWGDVHGRLVDFDTGEPWPIGMIRSRKQTIQYLLQRSGTEAFAYSQFEGFPGQNFDLNLLGGPKI